MKITSVVFGGGVSTLGMDVVIEAAKQMPGVDFKRFTGKVSEVNDCDVIFVSLAWFENILEYCRFLKTYGVDPKKKKPVIVIGGIAASNTRIMNGLFHYCVLGDGEVVIDELIGCILDGVEPSGKGIVKDGEFSENCFVHNKIIPAFSYIEDRGNNTARIEIARGCRYKCDFCQLAHIKPYIEQPIEVVEHLLKNAPTKRVGLFAPDRSGYKQLEKLEQTCKRLGKHNTAEDLRLDTVSRMDVVSKLKFGVEGFTEESRKRFRKVASNERLVGGLKHIFTDLKKPNGKRHTTATMYMIADLPGETPDNAIQFWDVLKEADSYCKPPFTMFLTLNSFSAKPFTPMENCGIHPYNKWKRFWDARPRMKNMTIASRGGILGPSNRITHMMTARGDERLTKLLFWLSNDGNKYFKDRSSSAGKTLESLIKKQGVDPEFIYGDLSESDKIPTSIYKI
jgi:radical SAM superfamily enzyme YgiQ (UPF0313 family)